jgi:hypothetical protein
MDYTSTLNGSGGWNRVPFLPIGSLLTGPQYNVDARISRWIPITDRVKAVALFERAWDARRRALSLPAEKFRISVNISPRKSVIQGEEKQQCREIKLQEY